MRSPSRRDFLNYATTAAIFPIGLYSEHYCFAKPTVPSTLSLGCIPLSAVGSSAAGGAQRIVCGGRINARKVALVELASVAQVSSAKVEQLGISISKLKHLATKLLSIK